MFATVRAAGGPSPPIKYRYAETGADSSMSARSHVSSPELSGLLRVRLAGLCSSKEDGGWGEAPAAFFCPAFRHVTGSFTGEGPRLDFTFECALDL